MSTNVFPILIYDNLCYSCTVWAKFVNTIVRGKCRIIGHYTPEGKKMKSQFFPKNYDGTEMSWFIIGENAYGGRSGLVQLVKYMILRPKKEIFPKNNFSLNDCESECKSVKGVIFRSWSILSLSKKIKIVNI